MPRYYYEKEKLKFNNIEHLCLYFDNNEYISLSKDELLDYEFEYQDRLLNYRDGIYPCAKRGYINFNIKKYSSGTVRSNFIYNEDKYRKNRKRYIFDRCIEGGILCVEFFNSYNWSIKVFGNFNPIVDNDSMSFEILDSKNKNISDKFYIDLPEFKKNYIYELCLDFENCETLDLMESDIQELNLNIQEKLILGSGGFERLVVGGNIKIKFDQNYKYRSGNLFDVYGSNINIKTAIKHLIESEEHWICNLYITYNEPCYGDLFKETLMIKDIRYDEDDYYEFDDEDDEEYDDDIPYFVGGHVQKDNDLIIITFE